MKIPIIFLLAMTVCACSEAPTANSSKNLTRDSSALERIAVADNKKPSLTSTECDFSEEMNEFIKQLQQDDYKVDANLPEDSLKFEIRNRHEVVKSYTFPPREYKFIFAKRNSRLERMKDNWYPNFRVYEICFENNQLALDYEKKLSEILSSPDLDNDKNYDYLLRHHNKIIYVTCRAKIFEEYAFKYRETIERIINKRR